MNARHRRFLAFGLFALVLFGPGVFCARRSHPSETSSVTGDRNGSLDFGGRTRTYIVHAPPSLDKQRALPVVLVLHGATESAENVERLSGMSAKADAENFIAVYPSGTSGRGYPPHGTLALVAPTPRKTMWTTLDTSAP